MKERVWSESGLIGLPVIIKASFKPWILRLAKARWIGLEWPKPASRFVDWISILTQDKASESLKFQGRHHVRQHQMQVESLAEQLFFTTLRIDTVDLTGNAGSGTGFFFGLKRGEVNFPFVVTNKHVVNNMRSGRLNFLKREGDKPLIGQGFPTDLLDWSTAWFGHPDPSIDIAILPFAPLEAQIKQQTGTDLFYRLVSTEMIPSDAQLATLDAIELVTFVGYPNGIWDSKNLLPVARRGTTASPLQVDFEGTPRFLIDASVFGGSSGSPVFILNQGIYTDKGGGTAIGTRLLFVGIVAAVFFRTQLNQIVAVPVPTQTQPMARQQEMIDLGIVFKAKAVVETIEAFLAAKGVA